MKVLIGEFITESNENIPRKNEITAYDIAFGEECVRKMHVGDIFAQAGIEVIPAVYAVSGASGVIKRHTFDYIEACFIRTVEEHLNEIDGIYMMLHGASEVEGLGSGEHHILAEVRKRVGPYVPIYVACDPHGNLCKEYVESAQVVRSYRESPHTDSIQTRRIVAGMLCEALKKRENIHAVYRKLPLILGGEQSVSADEPVKSINQYMDEMEKDPRICSASWHVGYIRHDTPVAGCGIVAVPQTAADQEYAQEIADKVAAYVWDKRHEFHYTGLTQEPEEAIQSALNCPGKPVFLTDSGDNTTSGSVGANTWVLRQVMALPDTKGKNFLFGCITDPAVVAQLADVPEGTKTHIRLGMDLDELSRPVELDVTVKHKGRLEGFMGYEGDYGACVLVSVEGYPIDIIVAEASHAVVELHQFEAAGAHCADYGVVIVKQGYIFPELKELGALCVMSLTDGATLQDTRRLPFKRIMRPMFPVDDI